MRGPRTALIALVVVTGVSVTILRAQQMLGGSAKVTASSAGSAASDPSLATRSSRQLLRNGLDYLDNYRDYDRALVFLREAESRPVGLNPTEARQLADGIERARSGLRDAVTAGSGPATRGGRPGSLSLAPPAPRPKDAVDEPVRRVSAEAVEPAEPPTLDLPALPAPPSANDDPAAPPAEGPESTAPETEPAPATKSDPIFLTGSAPDEAASAAPPESKIEETPEPSAAPAPASSPSPAAVEEPPAPPPDLPVPASGIPSLPPADEPSAPPASPESPAPVEAPIELPALPSDPRSAPAVPPANEPPALPALPEASALPEAPPELPASAPIEIPSSPAPTPPDAPLPTIPAGPVAEVPVADSPAPIAEVPVADSPAPIVEAPPVVEPAPAEVAPATPAPETPRTASSPRPGSEPVQGRFTQEPREALAPPAVAAEELPPLPPPVAQPTPVPIAPPASDSAPAVPASGSVAVAPASPSAVSGLNPETLREVEEIARRQDEEARNNPRPMLGAQASPDTATTSGLELTRAPSPTEPRPIRVIPVPEEFVPLPPRQWEPNRKYWAAAATCHMPLYFQDAVLERYGQGVEQALGTRGRFFSYPLDDPRQSNQRNQLLQPMYSAGLFISQLALLPYNLIVDPPWEAEYDLGYYRPGDRIPSDTYYLPRAGVGPALRGSRY